MSLLQPYQLHDYQHRAIELQCTHPATMLWLDVGLGKTIITLSSIVHLINSGYLNAVFVVAPIRVCRLVWAREATKWSHTANLKFSMVIGSKDQRLRALQIPAHVYLINYENIRWLMGVLRQYYVNKNRPMPANGIVWDEVSKMKNSGTKRVSAIVHHTVKYRPMLDFFIWRTGLTASPASNGYKDLHGQYLVVDGGQRLGRTKQAFRDSFMTKEGYKERPRSGAEDEIHQLVSDITLQMSAAEYNPLPDLIVNNIEVELPPKARVQYDELEREYFTRLETGDHVEVFNAASLTNKLLQFGNGAVYPIPGMKLYQQIHEAKMEALEDLVEELNGQQLLLGYGYVSDAELIMKRFSVFLKDAPPINLTQCKSQKSLNEAMWRWNHGECPLMLGHPASMGHGINGLQDSGHNIGWYGLTWSLDHYDQLNGRIRRQGQGAPVVCHRIVARDTMDQAQMEALASKAGDEAALRAAVKHYRDSRATALGFS